MAEQEELRRTRVELQEARMLMAQMKKDMHDGDNGKLTYAEHYHALEQERNGCRALLQENDRMRQRLEQMESLRQQKIDLMNQASNIKRILDRQNVVIDEQAAMITFLERLIERNDELRALRRVQDGMTTGK
jgi:hypothetical protein